MKLQYYIKQLRPKNWLKNVFVFVPIVFALALTNTAQFCNTLIVFLAFCMVSSAVYTFNDIQDIEADRNHPLKRNRPVASGAIGVKPAMVMSVTLMAVSLGFAFCINVESALVVALYIAENLLYSTVLKHKPLYDCFCIAVGFVLRIYAGSFASGEPVSNWLFLTVVAMSLFMAFGKRRGEMLTVAPDCRRSVLKHYDLAFLNGMMFVGAGLSVVFYALWAMSRGMNMIYTVPIIIFIVCKYLLLVHDDNSHCDPTAVILTDGTLIAACMFYTVVAVCFLYAGDIL